MLHVSEGDTGIQVGIQMYSLWNSAHSHLGILVGGFSVDVKAEGTLVTWVVVLERKKTPTQLNEVAGFFFLIENEQRDGLWLRRVPKIIFQKWNNGY